MPFDDCMPMKARKRPMPAEVASMTERGISSTSLDRTPSRVMMMKIKPGGQGGGTGEHGGVKEGVCVYRGGHGPRMRAPRRRPPAEVARSGPACARRPRAPCPWLTLHKHGGQGGVEGHAAGAHEADDGVCAGRGREGGGGGVHVRRMHAHDVWGAAQHAAHGVATLAGYRGATSGLPSGREERACAAQAQAARGPHSQVGVEAHGGADGQRQVAQHAHEEVGAHAGGCGEGGGGRAGRVGERASGERLPQPAGAQPGRHSRLGRDRTAAGACAQAAAGRLGWAGLGWAGLGWAGLPAGAPAVAAMREERRSVMQLWQASDWKAGGAPMSQVPSTTHMPAAGGRQAQEGPGTVVWEGRARAQGAGAHG